ncbi:MAG: DNA polymerase I [Chlorobiaceae bacterium]|nr:DNA polymerase I [Chlorobiaceae bacterium]
MSSNQLGFFPSADQDIKVEAMTPNQNKPALFLLDGMAMIYRAFFALQRAGMTSRDGMPTGAIYGFASALFKIFETYKPHYLAAVFDSKEKTFRHDMYPPYKANRQTPPEDLIMQLDAVFELLETLDIPLVKAPGYEADDLIGTAARKFEHTCQVYIVTPDKDLAQLVHDGVKILKPGKSQNELELFGKKEITEQFGIPPELFTQFLTLTGDTSDNIPGAKGIGPKTASSLLHKYGSLDNIYKHLDDISPKNRQSLEEFQPQLDLITRLVTIRTDLQIDVTLKELECGVPDQTKLLLLLQKLGLRTIIARLPVVFNDYVLPPSADAPLHEHQTDHPDDKQPGLRSPQIDADYALVDTSEKLNELVLSLKNAKRIAVDTETTSLDTFEAELAGMSFSIEAGKARFISFNKDALQRVSTLDILRPVLENPSILKTGQNLKYDILVLKKYGIELSPVGFDTMLASYVLDPKEQHNLDDLAARHLGYRTTTFDELVGTGKTKLNIYDVEPIKLSDYGCQDADLALQLEEMFRKKLVKEKELLWLCENIEFPLVSVLAAMEYEGISIDSKSLEKASEAATIELKLLTDKIYAATGSVFNIDSPQQLAHILFDVLGLPPKKTTKTGFSTNVEVLEALAPLHPVASDLLEYRSLQKLKNTYIDALPKMVNHQTGRLHTSFNQHITATGRLSSSNPNLQNIPIRTTLGKEIRRAFIPSSSEKWLLSADYSQIELRIAAEISADPQLLDAFRNHEDIHTATARVIFGTNEIDSDMRRKAKEVNFGILYGIMPFGLSKRLNISQKEAKNIIDTYISKYPGLFDALQHIIETGRKNGYVSTLLGRRRYIADLNSRNANLKKAAERAAMNTPIQGTAADIIKCAMILCSQRMHEKKMKSIMLLQVHDELLFETTDEEKKPLSVLIEKAMIDAAITCGLKTVPVEVDTGIGKNWFEAH